MTGTAFQRLFPVEVVAELLCFVAVLLCLDDFGNDEGLTPEGRTDGVTRAFVLADLLGDDVLGALESLRDGGGGDDRDVACGGREGDGGGDDGDVACGGRVGACEEG